MFGCGVAVCCFTIQPIIHCDSVKREQTMNNASGCNTADDNVTRGDDDGNGMAMAAATAAAVMMQFHVKERKNQTKNQTLYKIRLCRLNTL